MRRNHGEPIRRCSICGSDKTYISKKGYEDWGIDKTTGLIICKNCVKKQYRDTHKEKIHGYRITYYKTGKERPKHKEYLLNNRDLIRQKKACRILYRSNRISLWINPKSGRCQKCGVVGKRTNMHHAKGYNDSDILDGTIELCCSCHTKEHQKNIV